MLVGHGTFDDAGVFKIGPEQALVQTLDLFPPVIDDPYLYGQVAAANSLSDVYAMGGTPLTALGIACFPTNELPLEDLAAIMKGGADKAAEAGAVIAGGHSIRDPEVKFGLSVTGMVHPDRVCSNAGAQPGDRLFLTKALGMGPVTTAYRKREISEEHMRRAGELMAALNKGACEAMSVVGINEPEGVRAATDVTGFGLIGHAANLAEGSNVTLVFRAEAIPVFEGALGFAEKNMVSGALSRNEAILKDRVVVASGVDESLRRVVYDSETSGGLLIAVAEEGAGRLSAALAERGVAEAVEIGHVEARDSALLKVI